MTFLPIVDRELRVTARGRGTYRFRALTALVAILIGGALLLLFHLGGSRGTTAGGEMFNILSWYLFLICSLAGVFLAADSLSVERREGTLGLLFLTDLRGFDIVLGKLLAVSLNAFYALLAVFPILGLSLVLGGITGGEFGRMCLALTNALWFSVSIALWVSARSEFHHRATIQSLLLLVLFVVVLPAFDAAFSLPGWLATILSVSPFAAFFNAQAANYLGRAGEFWTSLAVCNIAGWIFLGLASWRLPRSLESAPLVKKSNAISRLFTGDLSLGKKRRRPELLDVNPVLWMMDDSRGQSWLVWSVTVLGCAAMLASVALGDTGVALVPTIARPFLFLLKILFAIQACRFFSEARRTGALELLCSTPILDKEVRAGLWLSLRRQFLAPVLVLMSAEILGVVLGIFKAGHGLGSADLLSPLILVPFQLATAAADFFAMGWLGFWLSLTGKKPQAAAGLTILFVLVLPTVAICVPSLIVDVVLISVFMSKLNPGFRKLATQTGTS